MDCKTLDKKIFNNCQNRSGIRQTFLKTTKQVGDFVKYSFIFLVKKAVGLVINLLVQSRHGKELNMIQKSYGLHTAFMR